MLHESLAGSQLHMWANSDTYMGADRDIGEVRKAIRGFKNQSPGAAIYYISPGGPIMTVLTSLLSRPSAAALSGQALRGMGARALHRDRGFLDGTARTTLEGGRQQLFGSPRTLAVAVVSINTEVGQ